MSENDHLAVASPATAAGTTEPESNLTPSQAKKWRQELCDELNSIGELYCSCPADHELQLIGRIKSAWKSIFVQVETNTEDTAVDDQAIIVISSFAALGPLERKKGPCLECGKSDWTERGGDDQNEICGHCGYPLEDDEGLATLAGKCWADLPYLGDTLYNYWTDDSDTLNADERKRLAIFTAKLLSVGLLSDDMWKCAPWLLKEILETERAPVEEPYMIEMLPACIGSITHAHARLLQICDNTWLRLRNWRHSKRDIRERETLIGEFSMDRWEFWRDRLGELYRSKDERISRLAREGFEVMIGTGRPLGITVYGERNFFDRAQEKLDEIALAAKASGGEVCTNLKQIKIDPDWVKDKSMVENRPRVKKRPRKTDSD